MRIRGMYLRAQRFARNQDMYFERIVVAADVSFTRVDTGQIDPLPLLLFPH